MDSDHWIELVGVSLQGIWSRSGFKLVGQIVLHVPYAMPASSYSL